MAPASTGRESNKRIAVIRTDQQNKEVRSINIPILRKFPIVLMKLTAPRIEEIPARCKEKIAKSTAAPECERFLLKGGYTVHPVPAPISTILLNRRSSKAGIINQNLMLFIRGNDISGAPNIRGTRIFPKAPIRMGITVKKIIMKACAVTITL